MNAAEPEQVENTLSGALLERAMVFGKWMWLYFWVTVASVPVALASGFELASGSGTIIGTVIIWALSAVLAYALFQTGRQQRQLKVCAWLTLVELAADVVMILSGSEMLKDLWEIPEAILGMVMSYHLCTGCGDALFGVDNVLSAKWHRLWKWLIGATIVSLISVPALTGLGLMAAMAENLLLVTVASVVSLALSGMMLVLRLTQYIYIYRTAKIFRGIAKNL